MEMCPEHERLEREIQKELDKLELIPGTTQADPKAAVKIYRRPAAGRELPLPEEVRPPAVLQTTLDYLLHTLLPADPRDPQFAVVQPFLWNRTRAIRQDFIVQSDRGAIAIACHERIARYHILCLHWKGGVDAEAWSEQQELEQLRKTLRSLIEYYDDQRLLGHTYPNEPEFRAYNLLLHIRDPESLREVELLPTPVFTAAPLQWALQLQTLVQRSNLLEKRGQPRNTEATPNFFTRFFKIVSRPEVSYLTACLAENLFPSVRIGAIKALARAYMPQHNGLPLSYVTTILGMDDDAETIEFLRLVHVDVDEQDGVAKINKLVVLDEDKSFVSPFSQTLVEVKRGTATCQDIVDGKTLQPPKPTVTSSLPPVMPSTTPTPTTTTKKAKTPSPPAKPFTFTPAKAPAAKTPAVMPPPTTPAFAWPAPPSASQPKPPPATPSFTKTKPPADVVPSTPAPPPKPKPKPRLPRTQLTTSLTQQLCDAALDDMVHHVGQQALESEAKHRRRVRRASLLASMASRLTSRLLAEPVAASVRHASMDALAQVQFTRHIFRATMNHWQAILAKQRDRKVQAERLEDLRTRLPHLHVSRSRRSSDATGRAPRWSDDERVDAFVHAQEASTRLWERGTWADSMVDRVAWLCHETMQSPPTFTIAVYVSKDGPAAGARWLRHKMGLSADEVLHPLAHGTQVRIVDGVRAPAMAQEAQLVVCDAMATVPTPSVPTPLLAVAWAEAQAQTFMQTHNKVWMPCKVVTLHEPTVNVDQVLREALLDVLPTLHVGMDRTPGLRTAIQPLWHMWSDLADAFDTLLARAHTPAIAADAFALLTSLANLLLRMALAAEAEPDDSTTHIALCIPKTAHSTTIPDTLVSLALHQLQSMAWGDPEAVSLLKAHTLEWAHQGTFHLNTYMQAILRMAFAYIGDAQSDAHVPSEDLEQFRSLGNQALRELASRVDNDRPKGPAPALPSPIPTTPRKRASIAPSHASKRIRDEDDKDAPRARLRGLLARSASLLLHEPRE